MRRNMLEKVIDSCKYVMNNAKFVTINYDQLNEFIKTINCKDLKHWLSNNPYNILDIGIENVINFMLLFESVDYSFWGIPKWTINTDLGEKDGSDALLYAMLKLAYIANVTGEPRCDSEIKSLLWIDRNYKEQGIKLGSILEKGVIPKLIEMGLM